MIFTDFNKILCPVEKKMRDAVKKLKSLNVPVKCNKSCHADFGCGKKKMCIGANMDCDVCLCDLLIAAVGFSIMVYFMAMLMCPKSKAMKKHKKRK